MSDPNDDMQYVTRKELREELAPIHAVLTLIVERMATKEDLLRFATKEDLAATEARIVEDVKARIAESETRTREEVKVRIAEAEARTREELKAAETRITDDVARHTRASAEESRALLRAIDDKYADVHPRLEKLETHSPRPKRSTRRRVGLRRRPR